MPLDSSSPTYLHVLQNISLLFVSALFAPLCTFITLCSRIAAPSTTTAKRILLKQKWRSSSSREFRPRIILITGVGMSKGLFIARAFHREGHIVIGADFEPYGVPVCGRFSMALKTFYRLSKPGAGSNGSNTYVEGLLNIIHREKVELWVSCSGVASAMDDAEAAEAIEEHTSCKVIQFGTKVTETLHEKHSFIQQTQLFGLNVPETHLITSVDDAIAHLHPAEPRSIEVQFIMKSVGLDDSIRADMTLLPRASPALTKEYLLRLNPSQTRPFVLQQYINGPEYCTHSLVVQGKVLVFTACPSEELLMHYRALSPSSALSQAMLEYTKMYAAKMGAVTGHFSIDFMLDRDHADHDLVQRLYPIECNPRAHTAVVLFQDDTKEMVDAYVSVLEDYRRRLSEHQKVVISTSKLGFYWLGHDIVTRMMLPLALFSAGRADLSSTVGRFNKFFQHATSWKEGTYETWDPWPFWFLYCIYWPGMFLSAIFTQSWWSRCNVSTTKMFRC